MIRILLAEDDNILNQMVTVGLEDAGYEVMSAKNGEEAWELLMAQDAQLLLTDIMMPQMDGFALAKKVREIQPELPILFMTAKDDKMSKQHGFRLGADDYIVKPFDLEELIMRVQAVLRRAKINSSKNVTIGNFTMQSEEMIATLNGEEIALTVREFGILFKLLSYPKKIFTRTQLMDEFWDFNSHTTSRTVDVYMTRIREKMADADGFEIQTVHGLGYKAVLK